MTTIYAASAVVLAMTGLCFWIIRRITRTQNTAEDLDAWVDITWQNSRPIERLLDPTDFEFLRRKGISQKRISQMRAKRRELFRMYLRRLTHEFNAVHAALRMAIVQSEVDRADLVRELGRQRLLFYRHLVIVEFRLTLNAAGFNAVPSLDLIRPLERLHLEFCNLVPAAVGAQA